METCIIGIDPGASGGIAWKYDHYPPYAAKMPDTQGDVLILLKRIKSGGQYRCKAYIEDIPKFVAGSDATQFSFAVMFENFGFIKGALQALEIPLIQVSPQRWQKTIPFKKEGVRIPKGIPDAERNALKLLRAKYKRDFKGKLKAEAQRRFPSCDSITLNTCDALLLLEYGLKQEGMPLPAPEPTLI